jgi:hypothetical protein
MLFLYWNDRLADCRTLVTECIQQAGRCDDLLRRTRLRASKVQLDASQRIPYVHERVPFAISPMVPTAHSRTRSSRSS